ncbi:T9SS type A sorting domain-containing protein [Porphyromonas gingivicanis]|uniref:T9SS type A sorting domain-containing protein n=1 Tax=Porphyromonas gingivicanis TaxID=266762 RepID=UPI0004711681|nr:T9SS type A sorting domain-containing protein [Porphyromonas gingivicanis]
MAQFDNAIEVPDAFNPTKVYPTITRETLFVEGLYSEYYIYSIEGACVAQGKASHRIDVAHLPEGNYIIRLLAEDGGMATHRFVRE